ncbi:MAG: methyl-accepting chemotaxis protein [Rugosibacter sp.]|nr:methyl-accepting chemotaxis protein [Rugosibacter sp.]
MSLANLRVGVRLGLGFGSVLVLLIGLVAIGLFYMSSIEERLENVISDSNHRIKLSHEMAEATYIESNVIRTIALFADKDAKQLEYRKIEAARANYDVAWEALSKTVASEEDKTIRANIVAASNTARPLTDKMIQLGMDDKGDEATEVLLFEAAPSIQRWLDVLQENVDLQEKVIKKVGEDVRQAYTKARVLMLGMGSLAVVLGMLISWLITRSIIRPLQRAVVVASAVAQGDLTQHIEVRTKDETGQLLQALKGMNESLSHIVGDVRGSTDSITTAAKQIAAGNSDLSQRTEEQASSLEETASSMEELTSTVRQNADNAKQANQLAVSASDVAVKGGQVVGQVVQTMASISDSSKKIVDIISVIEGIAFQTNILALNAAVEAARAGEQGRGFAVVAGEVRNLAQRSAAAAKEIKTLIGDSVDKVDTGAKLVDQAGATMNEIVLAVKRVTDIMSEISAASSEQSAGIEQVNQAVTQMDEVTQQNAALVEEAAAAAEALEEQARGLMEAVSVFKLEEGRTISRTVGAKLMASTSAATPASGYAASGDALLVKKTSKLTNATLTGDADGDWKEF